MIFCGVIFLKGKFLELCTFHLIKRQVRSPTLTTIEAPPNSLMDSTMSPKGEYNKRIRNWGTLPCS